MLGQDLSARLHIRPVVQSKAFHGASRLGSTTLKRSAAVATFALATIVPINRHLGTTALPESLGVLRPALAYHPHAGLAAAIGHGPVPMGGKGRSPPE